MYQPYIRGKQFELIGIRELTTPVLVPNKTKVSPIIEPVKNSSTLKTTLKELVGSDINFTVIANPQVGTFTDIDAIFEAIKSSVGDSKNYQIGIIFHSRSNHNKAIEVLQKYADTIPALTIIHNAAFENITDILALYQQHFTIKYNVINLSATSKRYHRNFEESTRVELDDYFNAQTKNSDY